MRHGDKQNNLGRKSAHREGMLGNMASSLIKHKRISTTVAKAKALRKYVEPLITKAKEDTTHSRRTVFAYLSDKEAVTELFRDVVQKIGDRPGGYTRILKTGTRLGDSAEMCIIELVDFNVNMLSSKADVKAKATRRSRKPSKTAADDTTATVEKKPAAKTAKKKVELAEKTVTKAKAEEIIEQPAKDEVGEDLKQGKE
ncbi:MAG: 50S ribosomal protein L17 [Bacteroidia bacterium]|nr:50S ribosomal protein L17 [Bacteroidia bacterium]